MSNRNKFSDIISSGCTVEQHDWRVHIADDPGKASTEEERAAAVLAHFQTGGGYYSVQPIVAVPVAEFRVLPMKITPE